MDQANCLFITGAAGRTGRAVCRHLLKAGYRIKALVRDAASPPAQELKEAGAEVIEGDLDKPQSYRHHFYSIQGLFSLQDLKGSHEQFQGISLVNLAKEYQLDHFVYLSSLGAQMKTGVPHWDSKYEIEKHVRESGLPYTIIRPGTFYDNFAIPEMREDVLKGKFPTPLDEHIVQQFVSANDVGRLTLQVFQKKEAFLNKTLRIVSEQLDQSAIAAAFSKELQIPVKHKHLPGLVARVALGRNLYLMYQWLNRNGGIFPADEKSEPAELPSMMKIDEWIRTSFIPAQPKEEI